jgi:S1-C subfamily serine protease
VSMPASLVTSLPLRGSPVQSHMVGLLFGEQLVSSVRLGEDVRVGRHVFRAPIVSTSEHYGGIRIGAEMLNHFVVTIDQRRSAMQFTRGGGGGDPSAVIESPPLKSLGFSYRPYDPAGRVVSVLPDSGAARAGVRVGDEVRSVDGVPAGDLDSARRAQIYERNEPVRVDFVRDGVPLIVQVPVTLLVP